MFLTFRIHLSTLKGSDSMVLNVYDRMYLGKYDSSTQGQYSIKLLTNTIRQRFGLMFFILFFGIWE